MYILADGGRIAASDPSEFVRILREGSWFDSECTDGEYMVNFSGRYRELHGVTVRTDTPEHFMDDPEKRRFTSGLKKPRSLYYLRIPASRSRWGFFFFHCIGCPPYPVFQRGAGFTTPFGKAFFSFHRPFLHDKN